MVTPSLGWGQVQFPGLVRYGPWGAGAGEGAEGTQPPPQTSSSPHPTPYPHPILKAACVLPILARWQRGCGFSPHPPGACGLPAYRELGQRTDVVTGSSDVSPHFLLPALLHLVLSQDPFGD